MCHMENGPNFAFGSMVNKITQKVYNSSVKYYILAVTNTFSLQLLLMYMTLSYLEKYSQQYNQPNKNFEAITVTLRSLPKFTQYQVHFVIQMLNLTIIIVEIKNDHGNFFNLKVVTTKCVSISLSLILSSLHSQKKHTYQVQINPQLLKP